MYNKHEIHQGVERVGFILKYTSNNIPYGICVTSLTSTQTTSTTTTTTITKAPTTTTTVTPAPTTSSPTSSTSQSTAGNDVYQVPVVKVEGPWGGGSSWTFKGKCTFEISATWAIGTLPVDLIFNQETSNLQVNLTQFLI